MILCFSTGSNPACWQPIPTTICARQSSERAFKSYIWDRIPVVAVASNHETIKRLTCLAVFSGLPSCDVCVYVYWCLHSGNHLFYVRARGVLVICRLLACDVFIYCRGFFHPVASLWSCLARVSSEPAAQTQTKVRVRQATR